MPGALLGLRRAWAAQVAEALAMISVDERDVLQLSYRYRMTQAQIADRLDLSIEVVRVSTMTGMRALSEILTVSQ